MKPLLFEKDATDFSTRGLYTLTDCISCIVTEERNGEYELELVYPTNGEYFREIIEDRIIVARPFENGSKQAFRIYRREAALEGEVTFNARHISYQLNFIPIDIVSGQADSAQTMMNAIAGAALQPCPFSFESDITTLTAPNYAVTMPCGLRSALGGQEGSVLDVFGGELEWDNWTVRLHRNRGSDNGVTIKYGKNLTELTDVLDIGDTITGVMAFYQYEDEGATRTVYSSPKVITVSDNPYAHTRIMPMDVSSEFEEIPTQADVSAYAEAWLRRTANADPTTEITVSFVPMGKTSEYEYDRELDAVNLCDTVHIRYPALGLSVEKKVTRTVWNVLADRYDEITLGQEATLVDTIAGLESGNNGASNSPRSIDLLTVYPVGAIYMSTTSVNPEILFGGRWERIKGKFLLAAADSGETAPSNSYAYHSPGATGGETNHTLSTSELPAHNHMGKIGFTENGFGVNIGTWSLYLTKGTGGVLISNAFSITNGSTTYSDKNSRNLVLTGNTGNGAAHNNVPPFLAVFVWKRIA